VNRWNRLPGLPLTFAGGYAAARTLVAAFEVECKKLRLTSFENSFDNVRSEIGALHDLSHVNLEAGSVGYVALITHFAR
jgi:hypothetical protein